MNENERIVDLELLRGKLDAAGRPILLSSLTAEALFARMDAGELKYSDPAETAPASSKVIALQWRRWGTLAAALLVVVSLYAAGRSGIFSGINAASPKSAETAFPEAAIAEDYYTAPDAPTEGKLGAENGGGVDNGLCTGGSATCAPAPLAELSGKAAEEAKFILERQTWTASEVTEDVSILFCIEAADYGFALYDGTVYDYSQGLLTHLDDTDSKALEALCTAALQ